MSWTGTVFPKVAGQFAGSGVVGLSDGRSFALPTADTSLANGTGANQINLAWADTRAYSTTPTTLDLANLTAATTNGQQAATFAAIKALLVINNDGTNAITVGNAATNPFNPGLSAATTTFTVQPGGDLLFVNPSAAGWTTTSANNLRIVAAAGTPSVTVVALGLD